MLQKKRYFNWHSFAYTKKNVRSACNFTFFRCNAKINKSTILKKSPNVYKFSLFHFMFSIKCCIESFKQKTSISIGSYFNMLTQLCHIFVLYILSQSSNYSCVYGDYSYHVWYDFWATCLGIFTLSSSSQNYTSCSMCELVHRFFDFGLARSDYCKCG